MELRQMPEIQKIAEYLRSMTFKKKLIGGCDTESVLDHFSVVTEKYENIILSILAQYGQHTQQNAVLQSELSQRKQMDVNIANRMREIINQYDRVIDSLYQQRDQQARQISMLKSELEKRRYSDSGVSGAQRQELEQSIARLTAQCHSDIEKLANMTNYLYRYSKMNEPAKINNNIREQQPFTPKSLDEILRQAEMQAGLYR